MSVSTQILFKLKDKTFEKVKILFLDSSKLMVVDFVA